jgi:hypothetical protein
VIMEVKRQKYVFEAHISLTEYGMGFKEFMGGFMRIKEFKEEFEMDFMGYNLRLAMMREFDFFIEYCKVIKRKINFNELKYKGNLLL